MTCFLSSCLRKLCVTAMHHPPPPLHRVFPKRGIARLFFFPLFFLWGKKEDSGRENCRVAVSLSPPDLEFGVCRLSIDYIWPRFSLFPS